MRMERYIGLDVHAASCTLAVVGPSGRRLTSQVVETSGAALVDALRSVPGQRHVCMEEGTQSQWLHEILSPHVAEFVVTGVEQRSYGPKSDKRDAFALAEALRVGAIKTRVHKGLGQYKLLRQLARAHRQVVGDVVRVQARLKAIYRSWGVPTAGRAIYGTQRGERMSQVDTALRPALALLYDEYDRIQDVRNRAQEELVAESHRHGITRRLETAPGMGPIRVAEAVAIIVAPHRFRTARQLWSYSGLGLVMRSSSDYKRDGNQWVWANVARPRGLNRQHNRTLKSIFKGAATTVIAQHRASPLGQHYDRIVAAGTKPNLARVTLARKIAAIVLAMWKTEEVYDPSKHHVHT
jgi:transposase